MAVIASGARDLAPISAALGPWLSEHWLDGEKARVTAVSAFGSGGVSNETLRVSIVTDGSGTESDVVLRLPPVGRGVFPTYDLEREHRIIEALNSAGIPVAGPSVYESDSSWIGEPFLAMPYIAGHVPAGQPRPYVLEGWLHDLSGGEQASVLMSLTDLLADLHRLDPEVLGIEPLGPLHDCTPSERMTRWWTDYLEWASEGSEASQVAEVAACFDWCLQHTPSEEPPASFVWGDARLGNVSFGDDLGVSAALDWEGATVAPAEFDLGLHLAHRLNMSEMLGLQTLPELRGFPGVEEQLERYQARLGRPIADLGWYMIVAAAGLATCRLAVQSALENAGRPPLRGAPLRPWVAGAMARLS